MTAHAIPQQMGRTTFSRTSFNSPCKDCRDRHRACHDTCEKYIKRKAEWRERGRILGKAAELDSYTAKVSIKAIDRIWRKHK